jgi:ribosomal protein S6--L-glutamate ligase
MKIGILSRNPKLYSTQSLVKAILDRGHEVMVIDPLRCYMNITSKKNSVHYKDQILDDFDAIIPRIGASITFYGLAVVRQFEMMGVYSINESVAISRSRDKLRASQILARKGVGLPVTGFSHATKMTEDLVNMVGGAPLVIKLLEGTQGKGVILAETQTAAESVIEAFRELDEYLLVQEYISEAEGCDIRCFVVGDKVVASMMRRAKTGEFRSNLHRGGRAEDVQLTKKEKETAILAAKVLGLNVAGVDIVRSNRGPVSF